MVSRCTHAYVSLACHHPDGDDRPYLEWHQLEHLPEKFQFPGILGAQRWVSTAACRAVRAVEVGDWPTVAHVTTYLMGDPIEETLDDFLGTHAPRSGPVAERSAGAPSLPIHFQAPLRLLEAAASPRTFLPPQVVPFRPNRGIVLVAEEPTDAGRWEEQLGAPLAAERTAEALAVPGVAGAWVFGSRTGLKPRRIVTPGHYRLTVYYLDHDPALVAGQLFEVLAGSWGELTRPVLVAPFESMLSLDWERFGPGADRS